MFKTRTDFGSEKNMVTVSDVKGLNDKSMTFKLTRTSELDGKEMRRLCDMFSSSKTEYCFLSEAAGKVEKLLWARFRWVKRKTCLRWKTSAGKDCRSLCDKSRESRATPLNAVSPIELILLWLTLRWVRREQFANDPGGKNEISFWEISRCFKWFMLEKSADSNEVNLFPDKLMYSRCLELEMISVGKKDNLFWDKLIFLRRRWMLKEFG